MRELGKKTAVLRVTAVKPVAHIPHTGFWCAGVMFPYAQPVEVVVADIGAERAAAILNDPTILRVEELEAAPAPTEATDEKPAPKAKK